MARLSLFLSIHLLTVCAITIKEESFYGFVLPRA
jgi:hypothetical protein